MKQYTKLVHTLLRVSVNIKFVTAGQAGEVLNATKLQPLNRFP